MTESMIPYKPEADTAPRDESGELREFAAWSWGMNGKPLGMMVPQEAARAAWLERASRAHAGDAHRLEGMPRGFIKPDTVERVYFHESDLYALSNCSSFRLQWKGHDFDTSEHAYQWEKFPESEDVRALILAARSAHDACCIADTHDARRRPDWDEIKVDVMRNILFAKAAQHAYVREKLLASGERVLVEDSWRDDFWGWGPDRDGQNVLGLLWMDVRDALRIQHSAAA